MKKEWHPVEVLKHSRHDWLNKIQLIKANLSLNRVDRAREIIEEISFESQNEAKLSNLNMPMLACLLMTFNWEKYLYVLEYEVLGEVCDLSHYDEKVKNWCEAFFNHLNSAVEFTGNNHLSLSIQLNDEIRFFFDFRGILKNESQLLHWLDQQENLVEKHVHNHEMTIVLKVK